MKRAVAFVAFALALPVLAAAIQPQRIASISQNGSTVTLRFENGTSVDVPATGLKIRRISSQPHQLRTMTVAQLSAMNGAAPLPAIAMLRAHDGTSPRGMRIRVFESDADTRAFLQQYADRQAARQARKSNQ